MILNDLISNFIKARDLGPAFLSEIDSYAAAHPELADEAAALKGEVAKAIDLGSFTAEVTAGFMGAIEALRKGSGPIGDSTANFG